MNQQTQEALEAYARGISANVHDWSAMERRSIAQAAKEHLLSLAALKQELNKIQSR